MVTYWISLPKVREKISFSPESQDGEFVLDLLTYKFFLEECFCSTQYGARFPPRVGCQLHLGKLALHGLFPSLLYLSCPEAGCSWLQYGCSAPNLIFTSQTEGKQERGKPLPWEVHDENVHRWSSMYRWGQGNHG